MNLFGANPLIGALTRMQSQLPPQVVAKQGTFGEPGSLVLKLTPRKGEEFMDWYRRYAEATALNPDPFDPRHHYDYVSWYEAMKENPLEWAPGVDPFDLLPHGPSRFKTTGHPTELFKALNKK